MSCTIEHQEQFNRRLYVTLERMRWCLGLSHQKWAEKLGISQEYYNKAYRPESFQIEVDSLYRFAQELEVSLDSIFNSTIDYSALARHYRGNRQYIPQKYSYGAFGKLRGIANVMTYANHRLGESAGLSIMNQLQIREDSFFDLDRPVNINLMTDITDICREFGFEDIDYINVGKQMLTFNMQTLGKKVREEKIAWSPSKSLEFYVEGLPTFVERNYRYSILRMNSTRALVASNTTQEAADALKNHRYGNSDCCLIRIGAATCAPVYAGFPHAMIKKVACIYHGDSECRFEVELFNKTTLRLINPTAPSVLQ